MAIEGAVFGFELLAKAGVGFVGRLFTGILAKKLHHRLAQVWVVTN